MNQEKIGKLISELRKQNNLTQSQLGEMVGVTNKAVSKWENGTRLPDISILNELSNILKITTTDLLNGEKSNLQITENKDIQYQKIINKELISFLNDNYQKCTVHLLNSDNDYLVYGLIIDFKSTHFISVNSIDISIIPEFEKENVYSFECILSIEKVLVYKTGNISLYEYNPEDKSISLNKILKMIKIYTIIKDNKYINLSNIHDKKIELQINYINENFEYKNILIHLKNNKIFENNRFYT